MTERRLPSNSFVLRIWWEKGGVQPTWRGWMQHAATGEGHYFDCLTELLALIEAKTGPLAQSPREESTGEAGDGIS
ncbi:MAG: hypothetical protein PVI07_12050 [Anaerolineae bacterium]